MDGSTLRTFCDLAYEKAGISLNESKAPLIAARVAKRIRVLGLSSEREYLDVLRGQGGEGELVHFVDAISTNFTSFFREDSHFEILAEIVRRWVSEGKSRLRFWSCASSSGEEPYSMAIVIDEACGGAGIDYRILGTDISTRMLGAARAGIYDEAQIDRVPKPLRTRYFSKVARPDKGGVDGFLVSQRLRERVTFARLNLSSPPFPMKGPIDLVFCRNVMIYFDRRIRQDLVAEIERLLSPGGYLIIGHSETLNGIVTGLRPQAVTLYRKPVPGEPLSRRSIRPTTVVKPVREVRNPS